MKKVERVKKFLPTLLTLFEFLMFLLVYFIPNFFFRSLGSASLWIITEVVL